MAHTSHRQTLLAIALCLSSFGGCEQVVVVPWKAESKAEHPTEAEFADAFTQGYCDALASCCGVASREACAAMAHNLTAVDNIRLLTAV